MNELAELNKRYFVTSVNYRSKGAGRAKKAYYTRSFASGVTPRDYLSEFARINRKKCGEFLCAIELQDATGDRWWDCDGYRSEFLANYRRRITQIRKEYGLTSSEVKRFMRVN